MAYDVTLVQVNATSFGFQASNTDMAFGTGSFDYLLFSMWTCIPSNPGIGQNSQGGPAYIGFLGFDAQPSSTLLTLANQVPGQSLFSGTYDIASPNVRTNHLVSVDCIRSIVQYYANDKVVSLTTGGWVASGSLQVTNSSNAWDFDVGSSGGVFPAFADLWCGARPSFVDLSVVANRRKFIHADLTPVDLGTNGENPFGTSPQIFQTVPAAGVPNDFLTNRGLGVDFALNFTTTLSFQTPGTCTLPPPPPALYGRPLVSILGKSMP